MYKNLIDNYTDKATVNMGWIRRVDMRRELKSHIMDGAEALAAQRNASIDGAIVREVLAKMGPPDDFAPSHIPKKSILNSVVILIGVTIFMAFFTIIVAALLIR